MEPNPVGLFDFLEAGIELREYAKFQFTRNLSDILELIADFGNKHGVVREDMAFLDVNVFKELYISSSNPRERSFRVFGGKGALPGNTIHFPSPLNRLSRGCMVVQIPRSLSELYYAETNYRAGNGWKES